MENISNCLEISKDITDSKKYICCTGLHVRTPLEDTKMRNGSANALFISQHVREAVETPSGGKQLSKKALCASVNLCAMPHSSPDGLPGGFTELDTICAALPAKLASYAYL